MQRSCSPPQHPGLRISLHGNVDRKLMMQLAAAGVLGGVLGATLVTQIAGATMRPIVFMYLLAVGVVIFIRCFKPATECAAARQAGNASGRRWRLS